MPLAVLAAACGAEETATLLLHDARVLTMDPARTEPGKYADLVVLDADLLDATPEEILEMGSRVLLTLVGGRVAHRGEAW